MKSGKNCRFWTKKDRKMDKFWTIIGQKNRQKDKFWTKINFQLIQKTTLK